MQTCGVVWTVLARSTYSRWIMEVPRWVPQSAHACTQAWQPMHGAGSMMKTLSNSLNAPESGAGAEAGRPTSITIRIVVERLNKRNPPIGGFWITWS